MNDPVREDQIRSGGYAHGLNDGRMHGLREAAAVCRERAKRYRETRNGAAIVLAQECEMDAAAIERLIAGAKIASPPPESPDATGSAKAEAPACQLCGEPMPPGEEMFKFHGYSGPCPTKKADPVPAVSTWPVCPECHIEQTYGVRKHSWDCPTLAAATSVALDSDPSRETVSADRAMTDDTLRQIAERLAKVMVTAASIKYDAARRTSGFIQDSAEGLAADTGLRAMVEVAQHHERHHAYCSACNARTALDLAVKGAT